MALNNEIKTSTKWTLAAEVVSKLITPITGMILARLLSPTSFGMVASIMVVTSFAEMFADAGFQKYFIQHEFLNDQKKKYCFFTALNTCCVISIIMWVIICVFSYKIACLLGAPTLSTGLCIASIGIILNSFSGMQSAIFKREFQFKLLFKLRLVTLCVPIFVTIPLAVLGLDYWALIIGTLMQQLATCLFQKKYMNFPLSMIFDFSELKMMLSFSLWTLFEAITIWLSTWGGFFIVGTLLDSYYLGIYRGATTLTGAVFSLINGVVTPVLFSALSRLQADKKMFKQTFYSMQKICIFFAAPVGVGLFIFRDVVVDILLGSQWSETYLYVGLSGITTCFSVVINNFSSEALRANGMPKVSSLSQLLYFPVLLLVLYKTASLGFEYLVIGTCLCSIELDIVKLIIMHKYMGFSIIKIIENIIPAICTSGIAGGIAFFLRKYFAGIWGDSMALIIYLLIYLLISCVKKEYRLLVFDLLMEIKNKVRCKMKLNS